MKNAKRLWSALLAVVLLLGIFVGPMAIPVSAAGGNTNVNKFEFSATELKPGDTFTVTFGTDAMKVQVFTLAMDFDNSLFKVTKVNTSSPYLQYEGLVYDEELEEEVEGTINFYCTAISTVAEMNASGHMGMSFVHTEDREYLAKKTLIKITFEVKEGASGTTTMSFYESSAGTDQCLHTKENPSGTQTLTIKGNEPEHTCSLIPVEGKPATCEDAGYEAYYKCSDETCGKLYSDAEGTNEIVEPVVIPAKGHGKTNGFRYSHIADTDTHDVICADCQKTVEEGVACTFEDGSHVCKFACGNKTDCADGNNDHKCDVCGTELSKCSEYLTKTNEVPATCSKDGVKAYWTCSCGKHYADDQAAQLIEDLNAWKTGDGKIVATGNHVYVPGEPVWSADNKTVTVTGECGCGKEASATAVATANVTTAGNCQTQEVITYTATFTESWITNKTVSKDVKGEKNLNVHIGGQKTEYTDNGDTHTVTITCECGGVISTETVGHLYGKDFECDCGHMLAGWQQKQGDWYYVVDGQPVTGTVRVPYPTEEINGVTYAPNADDLAYAQANADSKYTDAETAVFVFGTDGKFQQTTGIVGGNRYAVSGMISWHVGLVEVDGEYYYFIGDVDGGGNIAAEGDTYISRINGIGGFTEKEVYNFENGKFSGLNGLVDRYGDGVLYYYENSKLMLGNGLTKVGENYIYIRSNGQMVSGRQYWVAKTNGICDPGMYTFDDNGFLQSAKDPTVNGLVDGVYYKDGMPYYAGLIEIDGDTYYINSEGVAVTGDYYITKVDNYTGSLDVKRGDKLTFGADGKLVTE